MQYKYSEADGARNATYRYIDKENPTKNSIPSLRREENHYLHSGELSFFARTILIRGHFC